MLLSEHRKPKGFLQNRANDAHTGSVANSKMRAGMDVDEWDYAAKPKTRFTNWTYPTMSPLFNHRICPCGCRALPRSPGSYSLHLARAEPLASNDALLDETVILLDNIVHVR